MTHPTPHSNTMHDYDAFKALMAKYGIDAGGDHVGKGWFTLIEHLVEGLIKMGWDKDVRQIKEKFGGLRFYIGEGTAEMYALISDMENESLFTCEFCGAPGATGGHGSYWIKTLCDEHGKKWGGK